jgi:hypothetical protein
MRIMAVIKIVKRKNFTIVNTRRNNGLIYIYIRKTYYNTNVL